MTWRVQLQRLELIHMSRPLVSIIVRTRNEERWIDKCLDAIAAQDYREHEVILVDNKSTDATLKKAQRFNAKVLSISEFRRGGPERRNSSIQRRCHRLFVGALHSRITQLAIKLGVATE